MIPVVLPTDAVRLRAFLTGCWPIPRVFGGPANWVVAPRHFGHHFISLDRDVTMKEGPDGEE